MSVCRLVRDSMTLLRVGDDGLSEKTHHCHCHIHHDMRTFAVASLLCAGLLVSDGFHAPHGFSRKAVSLASSHYFDMPQFNNNNNNNYNNPKILVDKEISNIFQQNKEWKDRKEREDPDYFKKLGSGHHPTYMWIGCADARVPANEIMGEPVGSVFVARNVANMVVNTDFNLMSALQYAINVLKVDHIIVCGHYDCGGVRAAVQNLDHVPPLENWLRNIRDVYRIHRDELDAIEHPEARHRRLVEINVVEQCVNLFKTGAVQRRRVETYKLGQKYSTPRIHACVFDPKEGILHRLEVSLSVIFPFFCFC